MHGTEERRVLVVAKDERQAREYRSLQSLTGPGRPTKLFVVHEGEMEKVYGLEVHDVLIATGVSAIARSIALSKMRLT